MTSLTSRFSPPLSAGALWVHMGVLTLSALSWMGCGGSGTVVIQRADELPVAPRERGFVKLPNAHPSVWIYIDGRYKGRVADYPLRALLVSAGQRRLTLKRHQHSTVYHIITVGPEAPVTILDDPIALPEPPPRPRW